MWNYRVIYDEKDGTGFFQIVEVYYDEDGNIGGWVEDDYIFGWKSYEDLRGAVKMIFQAFSKPLLKVENNKLVQMKQNNDCLKPTLEHVDFSEYILKDLIEQGYEGETLLKEFKRIKEKLPSALDQLVSDASNNKTYVDIKDLDDYLDS